MKNKLFIKAFIFLSILTFTISSCKKEKEEDKHQTIKAINRTTCTYDIFVYSFASSGGGEYIGTVDPGQTKSFETSINEHERQYIEARPCSSCANCSSGNFQNVRMDGFFYYGETYTLLIDF